jgi:hypothetical protein
VAGTKHLWLQYRTRAGFSLLSTRQEVAIDTSQRLQITIPGSALPSPSGCEIWQYYVLMSNDSDYLNACVVATFPGYEADGITVRTPPFLIELSNDGHFALGASVANAAALSSITAPVNGMRRSLDAEGIIVEYDTVLSAWKTSKEQLFNTYVGSITGDTGANQDISAMPNTDFIVVPDYGAAEGDISPEVGFWLVNNSSVDIPKGKLIGLTVALGDEDVSTSAGIVGGIVTRFRGYVDVATGVLDISGEGGVGTMPGVSTSINDQPIPYQGPVRPYSLPKPLPPGSAYYLTVQCSFSQNDLGNRGINGAFLKFYPNFGADHAIYTPLAGIFGSLIFATSGRKRIYPGAGLTAIAKEGSGAIAMASGGGFIFLNAPEQEISNFAVNTANQNVIISINGLCLVTSTIPETAKLRAKVGTQDGRSNATAWAAPVAVSPGQGIQVAVTYPTQIRSDYPDGAIAGSNEGTFNATHLVVYVREQGQTSITEWEFPISPGATNQTVIVGTTAGTATGTSTPTRTNNLFGLYEASTFTPTAVSASTSFDGNYEVAIALKWENAITSIDHTAPPAIAEAGADYSELAAASKIWAAPVADLDALRSLDAGTIFQGQTRQVISVGKPYRYSTSASGTDDASAYSLFVEVPGVAGGFEMLDSTIWHPTTAVNGQSTPAADLGDYRDIAFNATTGDYWQKTAFQTWTYRGNNTGPRGPIGAQFATTTADFTQPAVDGSVVISVGLDEGQSFGTGQYIIAEDGANTGYYRINSIVGDALNCTREASEGDAAESTTFDTGTRIIGTGGKGLKGDQGDSIFMTTTASSAIPAEGQDVFFTTSGNPTAFAVGGNVSISDGVDGGIFEVLAVFTDPFAIQVQNNGELGNSAVGTTINSGAVVTLVGKTGSTGAAGALTGASTIALDHGTAPAAEASKTKIWADTSDRLWYKTSGDVDRQIAGAIAGVVTDATDAVTLGPTHVDKVLRLTTATAGSVTLPDDPAIPILSQGLIVVLGDGQITFAAGGGITIIAPGDPIRLKSSEKGIAISWLKLDATTYLISGALSE